MAILVKKFSIFISLFLFFSCAKISYLVEQGMGQMHLQKEARANDEVLNDPLIPEEQKKKIELIKKYKKFFYGYFEKSETEIYNKTTFLKGPAVTYLVVASPYDEIKAHEDCFPFMGCFPYLGFFNEESASGYQRKLESESMVTWKRPVYAYSTLGYLTDNILSSFFHYKDEELAELIFHELFHTIYFIPSEVDLNESLANYFARNLIFEYFNFDSEKIKNSIKSLNLENQLNELILKLAQDLQNKYTMEKEITQLNKEKAIEIFNKFNEEEFRPQISQFCKKNQIQEMKCSPLEKEWNNARFAAFMTYEKKSVDIEELHKKRGGNLRDFLQYLQKRYEQFKDDKEKTVATFTDYLFQNV